MTRRSGGTFEEQGDGLVKNTAEEAGEGGGEAGGETETGSRPLAAKPLCSGWEELGYGLS
jgi:hypothetical protein